MGFCLIQIKIDWLIDKQVYIVMFSSKLRFACDIASKQTVWHFTGSTLASFLLQNDDGSRWSRPETNVRPLCCPVDTPRDLRRLAASVTSPCKVRPFRVHFHEGLDQRWSVFNRRTSSFTDHYDYATTVVPFIRVLLLFHDRNMFFSLKSLLWCYDSRPT